jgi:hypothetical protein
MFLKHRVTRSGLATILFIFLLVFSTACNLVNNFPGPNNDDRPTVEFTEEEAVRSNLVIYYYFAPIESGTFPAGSVEILPAVLILSPAVASDIPNADPAANLEIALQAVINDARNAWSSPDMLTLTSVTVNNGQATIALSGQILGAGDIVLIAARMQFLLTVFAEPSVQTAIVTLNGESIGNLGISHSSEAKPDDYAYTRADIEAYMTENAYNP